MRPSFHCASAWPFSAAYSSECTAWAVLPALSQCAPERNASIGVGAAADAAASSDLLPSKASAGAANRAAPITNTPNRASRIGITLFLGRPAGMGDGAIDGGTHL